MKICAYVQKAYSKRALKNECMDGRKFIGLRVVIDALNRAGYDVEWAGLATVHEYDVVLVSLTADCDWWPFITERRKWRDGNYKVIVGGAGVLHVVPFLRFADYFALGRGEKSMVTLIEHLDGKDVDLPDSIIESAKFSYDRTYYIEQTDEPYPHCVKLGTENDVFQEGAIGCNHKCYFCGYTWHRKFMSSRDYYAMDSDPLSGIADKERALLDIQSDPQSVDLSKLRMTAIDGFSERLRYMVNKKISREALKGFLRMMMESDAKPHRIRLYNICGYPTETEEDWWEYIDTLRDADESCGHRIHDAQWSIVLQSTPFRPMPATPLACAPMSKRNYRGLISATLGSDLKGGLIYQGKNVWSVETMSTESLPTVALSAIAHRGSEADTENIEKLCATKKFWRASTAVKQATLEKHFNLDELFGEYTAETLPSRYLRTYAAVEKLWDKPPWKEPYIIKPIGGDNG